MTNTSGSGDEQGKIQHQSTDVVFLEPDPREIRRVKERAGASPKKSPGSLAPILACEAQSLWAIF